MRLLTCHFIPSSLIINPSQKKSIACDVYSELTRLGIAEPGRSSEFSAKGPLFRIDLVLAGCLFRLISWFVKLGSNQNAALRDRSIFMHQSKHNDWKLVQDQWTPFP